MSIARAMVIFMLVVNASASMWDIPEQPIAQPNATVIEPKQAIGVSGKVSVNIQTMSDNKTTVCQDQKCTLTSKACDKNAAHQDAASPVKAQKITAEAPKTAAADQSTVTAEAPKIAPTEESHVDSAPQAAQLTYTSVAELAVELGLVTDEDAQGIFSSRNQHELFKHNSWSMLTGTTTKVTTFKRIKTVNSTHARILKEMVKKFEDQEDPLYEFQTPQHYVEKTADLTNTYHILGYLDQSTRLLRLNNDPQDVFIAKFKTFNDEEIKQGNRYIQLQDQAEVGDTVEYTIQVPNPSIFGSNLGGMGEFLVGMEVESIA